MFLYFAVYGEGSCTLLQCSGSAYMFLYSLVASKLGHAFAA